MEDNTMKRTILLILSLITLICFTACGNKSAEQFEELSGKINTAITSCDMETAYQLCKSASSFGFSEEQMKEIKRYEMAIQELCYPGTFVVKPENIIEPKPIEIGKNSYFTVGMLKKYDEVFCRYTFNKNSEKDLAAQQYKKYLNSLFTYLDLDVGKNYTVYRFADKNGNSIRLQVFDNDYRTPDFCVTLDSDIFDLSKIDTSELYSSLNDSSILLNN